MLIRIRRRVAAALATIVAFGLVIAVSGNPAYADIACPLNVVCTYSEANWHGDMYYYSGLGSCTEIGPLWSGRISSIINNKTLPVKAHYNTGCSTSIWNTTINNYPNTNNRASFQYSQINDHVHSLSYA